MSNLSPMLFSDAAKLYAANAAVVKTMHELCAKEYMTSLDQLFGEIREHSRDSGFSEFFSTNKKNVMESHYRYWHVGPRRAWENFVYLWIDQFDFSWVDTGVLRIYSEAGTKTPIDVISRMRAFPSLPQLAGFCKEASKSGSRFRIFQIELKITSQEELEDAADKIAEVLDQMKIAQDSAIAAERRSSSPNLSSEASDV